MVAVLANPPGIEHWMVVFTEQDRSVGFYWWQVVTGRKWAHVILVGLSDCGYMVVNPNGNHMYIEHFISDSKPHEFLTAAMAGVKVAGCVEVQKKVEAVWKSNFHVIYSCVSVAKDILNIKKPFIITPKQLHDHLFRVGSPVEFTLHGPEQTGIIQGKEGERWAVLKSIRRLLPSKNGLRLNKRRR